MEENKKITDQSGADLSENRLTDLIDVYQKLYHGGYGDGDNGDDDETDEIEMSDEEEATVRQSRRTEIIGAIAFVMLLAAIVVAFPVIGHHYQMAEAEKERKALLLQRDAELRETNSDYVGWLSLGCCTLDEPVVRGADNVRYLDTSFKGKNNKAGTIFIDYRCLGEIDEIPHFIVYGHNTSCGQKFGCLKKYLNDDFLNKNPLIVFTVEGEPIEYRIFSVRHTDISDPAYFLNFDAEGAFKAFLERNNAPLDSTQIITLSTCVDSGAKNERLIVQGARVANSS